MQFYFILHGSNLELVSWPAWFTLFFGGFGLDLLNGYLAATTMTLLQASSTFVNESRGMADAGTAIWA